MWQLPAPPQRVAYVERRERQTCKARTTPERLCFLSFVPGLSSRGRAHGSPCPAGLAPSLVGWPSLSHSLSPTELICHLLSFVPVPGPLAGSLHPASPGKLCFSLFLPLPAAPVPPSGLWQCLWGPLHGGPASRAHPWWQVTPCVVSLGPLGGVGSESSSHFCVAQSWAPLSPGGWAC